MDVSITTAKDCDIREKLFYRLAEAKCPILQMNSSTMSLEDVFLELTGNPAKAAKNLERQMGQKSGGDGMEEDFSEEADPADAEKRVQEEQPPEGKDTQEMTEAPQDKEEKEGAENESDL